MKEKLSITQLRSQLYKVFDQIIATGEGVEVKRKGVTIRIEPKTTGKKLSRVRKLNLLTDQSDLLLGIDWLKEWKSDLP